MERQLYQSRKHQWWLTFGRPWNVRCRSCGAHRGSPCVVHGTTRAAWYAHGVRALDSRMRYARRLFRETQLQTALAGGETR